MSQLITTGAVKPDPDRILRDILAELVALERAGLYHDDVRLWNVLVTPEGSARLIDFGSISTKRQDCTWPHDLMLSFVVFMREVFAFGHSGPTELRLPLFDANRLPAPWNGAVTTVLASPHADWTFARLSASLDAPDPDASARAGGFLAAAAAVEQSIEHLIAFAGSQRSQNEQSSAQLAESRQALTAAQGDADRLRLLSESIQHRLNSCEAELTSRDKSLSPALVASQNARNELAARDALLADTTAALQNTRADLAERDRQATLLHRLIDALRAQHVRLQDQATAAEQRSLLRTMCDWARSSPSRHMRRKRG